MGSKTAALTDLYDRLFAAYGPQHWWPGESPFEVMVGAILTQNTAWANLEKAIAALRAADVLDPQRLRALPPGRLAELIRPAGTFNVKARRLRAFLEWFEGAHGSAVDSLRAVALPRARASLLEIRGIGPETADSILLYALGHPTFVVDAYTWRVLRRHRLAPDETGYDELKALFEDNLPADAALFNEYHALLVRVAKTSCRARARCAGCPLEGLPHDREP
ncbi:MAG: endonuclease III domain-containing protein [Planctomycetes bacterium]|nr:endonuclease III domain-containing protein [Planctomycetota bacterium]